MNYAKIRMDFKYAERGKFYRILLVREDIGLYDLANSFQIVIGARFEHLYAIDDKKKDVCYSDLAPCGGISDTGDMELRYFHLSDLSDIFEFCYDFGEGYDFKCRKYKKIVTNIKSKKDVILLEGKGQGIWEDNITSLATYLAGEIPPEETGDYNGSTLPWNFDNETYGDFDLPLDIDSINEELF